jgi:pimeloyl-ACP methyl ester carboxylesterase
VNPAKAALGVAAGVIAAGGALYGLQRTLVGHAMARPDPDADRDFSLAYDRYELLPSHDGGSIAVYERGEGPVIVLVHGVTLSSRTWTYQFETLPEAGYRVIAVDLRGHGESGVGDSGYSIDNLGRDVCTVLEALDLHDCVLLGHSLGGIAVESFAIQFPEVLAARVAGLVLLSTTGRSPVPTVPGVERSIDGLLGPALAAMLALPNFGFTLSRLGFGRGAHPRHVDLTRRMISSTAPETVRASLLALAGMNLIPALGDVRCPTLIISGTADLVAPVMESRRLARTIPDAHLVEFHGAGHMLMLERPVEFEETLLEFAKEVGVHA